MADDVIKSFVVSIGTRVDEPSFKNIENVVGRATRNVTALGAAAAAALLAVNTWAAKAAGGFDQLFYSSQRMGASAANIKALSYGLSQMGSNASAANSSMESFARTLRNNRGYYEVLERLGVRTRNAQGVRRDTTELMQEFGRALRSQTQEARHLYLEMFGIDDATGRALIQGVDKFANEYREKLRKAGLDPDKAARDANALQTTFRSIGSSIEVIGAKVTSRLFSDQNNAFSRFIDFLDRNGDKVAGIVSKLALLALQLAEALIKLATDDRTQKFLDAMLSGLGKVDEKTGEFTADVDKLKTALEVFAVFAAGTWLAKLLGAFGLAGRGWTGLLRTLGLPVAAGLAASGGGHMTPDEYKGALEADPARRKADEELNSRGGSAKRWWKKNMPTWLGGEPASSSASGGVGSTPGSSGSTDGAVEGSKASITGKTFRQKAPGVMQRLMEDFGLSKEEAGVVLGNLGHESAGFTAFEEGGGGPGRGWAQWTDPGRKRRFFEYAQKRGLDPKSDEANYGFLRWELQNTHKSSIDALKRGRTVEEKMFAFEDKFEGARVKAYGSRNRYMRDAIKAYDAAQKPPKLTADDILPGGLKGAINGNLPGLMRPNAPPVSNNQSSTSITVHQGAISVAGMDDGKRVADRIGEVQGYRTSDLVRNLRRSVA